MVGALKWVRKTVGPIGLRGFVTKKFLRDYESLDKDSAVDGWGECEVADEKETHVERYFTLEQISLYEKAIRWQAKYMVNPGHRRSAIILNHWRRQKVEREFRFHKWVKEQGTSTTHAYRVKDKRLSLIAQGLHCDGEGVPEPIPL